MSQAAKPSRAGFIGRSVLRALFAVTALALIAVVITLAALRAGPGRALVTGLLEGRDIAGYGRLSLEGLAGNPLSRLSLERLSLEDATGVWLEAEDIVLEWRPARLLAGEIHLTEISAGRLDVLRQPERAARPQAPGGSGGVPPLRLDRLALAEARLAEGVIGPQAVFRLSGAGALAGGEGRAILDLERLDAAGDRLNLAAVWGDQIRIEANLRAAAGGPMATLLRAPDTALTVALSAEGDRRNGDGVVEITAGESLAGAVAVAWGAGRITFSGEADPAAWPEMAGPAALLGGAVSLSAAAPLGEAGLPEVDFTAFAGRLSAPNLRVEARQAGPGRLTLTGSIERAFIAGLTDAAAAERVRLEGALDFAQTPLTFEGRAQVARLETAGVVLERFEGPIAIGGPLTRIEIAASGQAAGARYPDETFAVLLGAEPRLEAALVLDRQAQRIEVERASARGPGGEAQASGIYQLRDRTLEASMRIDATDLSDFGPDLGGTARAEVTVAGALSGPMRLSIAAQARALSGPLRAYLGERAEGSAQLVLTAERSLALERLSLESPDLILEAQGARSAAGWRLAGDLAWSGSAPAAPISIEGALAAAFAAQSGPEGLSVRAEVDAAGLSAGPARFINPQLRFDLEGPLDALSGRWRLMAESPPGPVDLSGDLALAETGPTARFSGLAGGYELAGRFTQGQGETRLSASAETLDGFGAANALMRLTARQIMVEIEGEDLRLPGGLLADRLQVSLEGPMEAVALSAAFEGALGARLIFNVEGEADLSTSGPAIALTPRGRWGAHRFGAEQPIRFAVTPDGSRFDAALTLGEGRISLEGSQTEAQTEITAMIDSAPTALIGNLRPGRPLDGVLNGDVRLVQSDGLWRGQAALSALDLQPEASQARPVDLRLDARLGEDGLGLGLRLNGDDLTARADARIGEGPVASLGAVFALDAPLSGQAVWRGQTGPIASALLGEGRTLNGALRADASLGGRLGAPDLRGGASLSEGFAEDTSLGLRFTDIEAEGAFTQNGFEITRFRAADGGEGRLEAKGFVRIETGRLIGGGSTSYTDFVLVEQDELFAAGDGSAEITLEGGLLRVSGETRLDRAEARPAFSGRQPIASVPVTEINAPAGSGRNRALETQADGIEVALDYRVQAQNQVFVRTPQLDSEWSLDVVVTGDPLEPELRGNADLVRGRADVLGRNFTLQSGTIAFAGPISETRLDILATRSTRDIEAQVRIRGAAMSPSLSLSSSPSLPEDEIAARLLFNGPAGSLTAGEGLQLAAALASLSGGGGGFDPLGSVRAATGLDQLVLAADEDGAATVTGGRYLTEDVYLEVSARGGGGAGPTTQIEWTLTPNLTLLSRLEADGEAGITLAWRREYD